VVINGATNATTASVTGFNGIEALGGSTHFTIINYGTVKGAAASGGAAGIGITRGTIINGPSGAIGAYVRGNIGAYIQTGSVLNYGTIKGGVFGGFLRGTVAVFNGASGSTGALITGTTGIYEFHNTPATVVNFGTISAIQTGVTLKGGGTVKNHGTIQGSGGTAVILGGSANLLTLYPGAVLSGTATAAGSGNVLELGSSGAAGTITGLGGTSVTGFGTIQVDSGAQWTITGANTIASGTTLTNSGTLTAAGTLTDTGAFTNTSTLPGNGKFVVDPTTFTNSGYTGIQVDLADGSGLSNTGAGTIKLAGTAVYGYGAATATVINAGTIDGTGAAGIGVYLKAGGYVANTGAAALISGGKYGIKIAGGVVTNAGTISGRTDAVLFGAGNDRLIVDPGAVFTGNVDSGGGGNVLELASGASTGTISGLVRKYLNFGAVVVDAGASWVVSGSNVPPITIGTGGYVDNAGTLTSSGSPVQYGLTDIGPVAVYGGSAVSVVNTGTISLGYETAIFLRHGGSVYNSGTAAYISAYSAGIRIGGTAGTVTNSGTITGGGNYIRPREKIASVVLLAGGSVDNSGSIGGGKAIYVGGAAGTVTNSGTIGYIQLGAGGSIANTTTAAQIQGNIYFGYLGSYRAAARPADGTITNAGTISGYISLYSGSIANTGTAALISGRITVKGGGGVVSNAGTMNGGYIQANYGASVTNTNTAALISGGIKLGNNGGPHRGDGTVSNAGTIAGGYGINSRGVYLAGGGTITNIGTASQIHAFTGIILVGAVATVTNAGTIISYSYGFGGGPRDGIVASQGTFIINNQAGALISAPLYGVFTFLEATGTLTNAGTTTAYAAGVDFALGGASTVINAGTIAGGSGSDAVAFGSGNDRLVVDPGAVFIGNVDGGGGNNTLELASATSAGTISGFGTSFQNFGSITVDAGAQWTITGSNTLASTTSATIDGTLVGSGPLTNAGTPTGSGTLVIDPTTFTNSGYSSVPVDLTGGSSLVNTSTGTIKVNGTAVYGATESQAYVTNAGTIEGIAHNVAGIYLAGGGTITNGATNATGALVSGYTDAVSAGSSAAATIINFATIKASGNYFYVNNVFRYSDGVYLRDGGSVANNGTAALISGYGYGVKITGATGTVRNAGTIQATGTHGLGASVAEATIGVNLAAGGTVANTGTGALISGVDEAIYISGGGGAGTITNAGTIQSPGNIAIFIRPSGASVTNDAAAQILGGSFGVDMAYGGTVVMPARSSAPASAGFRWAGPAASPIPARRR
jgi:hypothetical protein